MIFEDFVLDPEALEPTIDLSGVGFSGPYPVIVIIQDEGGKHLLERQFEKGPIRIVNPQLQHGTYGYRFQHHGQCMGQGHFRFP